ncbi:hypothetical protein [uncultured Gemella sp.]|uniref:hypothetical protein n=1 Tax=uncultured Gemella sp. TaxID=254352 RepID=UPI0028E8C9C2|nr:hypothetical protein [uncultured Gemella sp.]
MSTLEILLGVFSLIFCIFYMIVFVIARKTIKKEELLLEKLTDKEIEKIRLKENSSKSALLLNLGITISCYIYLLISIINKGLLISFFGETVNKVINSIIIVIILLPHLLERINVIRRYNKVKKMAVNN